MASPLDSGPPAVPDAAAAADRDAAPAASVVPVIEASTSPPVRTSRRIAILGWWNGASDNFRASIILLGSLLFFTAMITLIKVAGHRLPLVEILTIRQLVMQILITPFSIADFPRVLHTRHPVLQLVRGLLSLGGTWLGFAAVIHLPLAHATAISFAYAIFVTIGAAFLLKEAVDRGRWIATAVGLAGVLVMLRPTGDASLAWTLVALLGAVSAAGMVLSLRYLSHVDRIDTILTYQALIMLAAFSIPTVFVWVTPTLDELMLLVLIGVLSAFGQWMFTLAFRKGEAAALAPLDFVRLLLTTACGLVFFGESLHVSVFAGAIIVIGATVYTFRANAAPARRPPPNYPIN